MSAKEKPSLDQDTNLAASSVPTDVDGISAPALTEESVNVKKSFTSPKLNKFEEHLELVLKQWPNFLNAEEMAKDILAEAKKSTADLYELEDIFEDYGTLSYYLLEAAENFASSMSGETEIPVSIGTNSFPGISISNKSNKTSFPSFAALLQGSADIQLIRQQIITKLKSTDLCLKIDEGWDVYVRPTPGCALRTIYRSLLDNSNFESDDPRFARTKNSLCFRDFSEADRWPKSQQDNSDYHSEHFGKKNIESYEALIREVAEQYYSGNFEQFSFKDLENFIVGTPHKAGKKLKSIFLQYAYALSESGHIPKPGLDLAENYFIKNVLNLDIPSRVKTPLSVQEQLADYERNLEIALKLWPHFLDSKKMAEDILNRLKKTDIDQEEVDGIFENYANLDFLLLYSAEKFALAMTRRIEMPEGIGTNSFAGIPIKSKSGKSSFPSFAALLKAAAEMDLRSLEVEKILREEHPSLNIKTGGAHYIRATPGCALRSIYYTMLDDSEDDSDPRYKRTRNSMLEEDHPEADKWPKAEQDNSDYHSDYFLNLDAGNVTIQSVEALIRDIVDQHYSENFESFSFREMQDLIVGKPDKEGVRFASYLQFYTDILYLGESIREPDLKHVQEYFLSKVLNATTYTSSSDADINEKKTTAINSLSKLSTSKLPNCYREYSKDGFKFYQAEGDKVVYPSVIYEIPSLNALNDKDLDILTKRQVLKEAIWYCINNFNSCDIHSVYTYSFKSTGFMSPGGEVFFRNFAELLSEFSSVEKALNKDKHYYFANSPAQALRTLIAEELIANPTLDPEHYRRTAAPANENRGLSSKHPGQYPPANWKNFEHGDYHVVTPFVPLFNDFIGPLKRTEIIEECFKSILEQQFFNDIDTFGLNKVGGLTPHKPPYPVAHGHLLLVDYYVELLGNAGLIPKPGIWKDSRIACAEYRIKKEIFGEEPSNIIFSEAITSEALQGRISKAKVTPLVEKICLEAFGEVSEESISKLKNYYIGNSDKNLFILGADLVSYYDSNKLKTQSKETKQSRVTPSVNFVLESLSIVKELESKLNLFHGKLPYPEDPLAVNPYNEAMKIRNHFKRFDYAAPYDAKFVEFNEEEKLELEELERNYSALNDAYENAIKEIVKLNNTLPEDLYADSFPNQTYSCSSYKFDSFADLLRASGYVNTAWMRLQELLHVGLPEKEITICSPPESEIARIFELESVRSILPGYSIANLFKLVQSPSEWPQDQIKAVIKEVAIQSRSDSPFLWNSAIDKDSISYWRGPLESKDHIKLTDLLNAWGNVVLGNSKPEDLLGEAANEDSFICEMEYFVRVDDLSEEPPLIKVDIPKFSTLDDITKETIQEICIDEFGEYTYEAVLKLQRSFVENLSSDNWFYGCDLVEKAGLKKSDFLITSEEKVHPTNTKTQIIKSLDKIQELEAELGISQGALPFPEDPLAVNPYNEASKIKYHFRKFEKQQLSSVEKDELDALIEKYTRLGRYYMDAIEEISKVNSIPLEEVFSDSFRGRSFLSSDGTEMFKSFANLLKGAGFVVTASERLLVLTEWMDAPSNDPENPFTSADLFALYDKGNFSNYEYVANCFTRELQSYNKDPNNWTYSQLDDVVSGFLWPLEKSGSPFAWNAAEEIGFRLSDVLNAYVKFKESYAPLRVGGYRLNPHKLFAESKDKKSYICAVEYCLREAYADRNLILLGDGENHTRVTENAKNMVIRASMMAFGEFTYDRALELQRFFFASSNLEEWYYGCDLIEKAGFTKADFAEDGTYITYTKEEEDLETLRSVVQDITVPEGILFHALSALGTIKSTPKEFEKLHDRIIRATPLTERKVAERKATEIFADIASQAGIKVDLTEASVIRLSDLLKQLCIRVHDGDVTKVIEELNDYVQNSNAVGKALPENLKTLIVERVVPLLIKRFEDIQAFSHPSTVKVTLFPLQVEAVVEALKYLKPIKVMGTGTGKTETAAVYCEKLIEGGEAAGALWVTKSSSRVGAAKRLREKILKAPYNSQVDVLGPKEVALSEEKFKKFLNSNRYIVVGADTLHKLNKESPENFKILQDWLQDKIRVLDEFHILDKKTSKRSTAVRNLNSKFTLSASATPFQHDEARIATILHMNSPEEYPDIAALTNTFTRNPKLAEELLRAHSTIFQLEDLALPFEDPSIISYAEQLKGGLPRVPTSKRDVHEIPLSRKQTEIYIDVATNFAAFAEANNIPPQLSQVDALRRIIGNPESIGAGPPLALIEGVKDLALPALREGKKVFIAAENTALLKWFLADPELALYGSQLLDGSKSPEERHPEIVRYEEDPTFQCLIGQVDAIGSSDNFRSTDLLIVVQPPKTISSGVQLEGRISRAITEGEERFGRVNVEIKYIVPTLDEAAVNAVPEAERRKVLKKGTVYDLWTKRFIARLERYKLYTSRKASAASLQYNSTQEILQALSKQYQEITNRQKQFELLSGQNLARKVQTFGSPEKTTWREQFLKQNILRHLEFLGKEPKDLKVALLPGPEGLELDVYLELGVLPENVYCFESSTDPLILETTRKKVVSEGCRFYSTKIEAMLPQIDVPFDIISIDPDGYIKPDLVTMFLRLPVSERALVAMNTLGRREGGESKEILEIFEGTRENIQKALLKLIATEGRHPNKGWEGKRALLAAGSTRHSARILGVALSKALGIDKRVLTELLGELYLGSMHVQAIDQHSYVNGKGSRFHSTFAALSSWDSGIRETDTAVRVRELMHDVHSIGINRERRIRPSEIGINRKGDSITVTIGNVSSLPINLTDIAKLLSYFNEAVEIKFRLPYMINHSMVV